MGSIYFPTIPTAPRPAVPVVINIGKVSQVLAMFDLQKNKIFSNGSKTPDNRLWLLLCAVSEVLDWFNTNLPNHPYVEPIANYLWALITPYQIAALRALGNGGGIVINPQTGAPLNIAPFRFDFTIGQAGSLMNAGDTILTIVLSNVFLAQFEPSGINETFNPNNSEAYATVIYNVAFVQFILSQPVVDGEEYIVWGLRGGNITSIPNTGMQIPLPLKEGEYLTNTGTLLLWDSPEIKYTSADFNTDGVTIIDPRLAIHDYDLYYESPDSVSLISGVDYTPIDSGGFTILIPGFDARTGSYILTARMKGKT